MERTLFGYIFRHSLREQITLVVLTALSFPFLYLSLDLPKIIINEAIGGQSAFPVALGFGTEVELEQIPYLMVLSGVFLALVCINGAFKYTVNVYAGVVGERMLRRLRYTLYRRMMRFPLPHFRKVGQGEVVSMVVAETEPLAGFIGDSIKLPVFQGGTLLTILIFMFAQDWVLGVAAIALYPLQAYVIPKLQIRVNQLKRSLVLEKRQLSERIGEVVGSVQEVHANDTSEYEGAVFSERLGSLYGLRLRIYKRKFFIKFLNNFLAQVTPFFFYSVGGYLVITGELTFGALVAVLAAYKDLNAPWKELLNYYQLFEDARIKYGLLHETFDPPGMMDERAQSEEPDQILALDGDLVTSRVDVREEADSSQAGGITFRIELPRRVAVVGGGGSGAQRLALILARLNPPLSGQVFIGDVDLASMPETVTGRRLGYVGQDPKLKAGSVLENLLYPLKRRPLREPDYDAAGQRARAARLRESIAAGNSHFDTQADWVDYEAMGVSGPDALTPRVIEALGVADFDTDIYEMGLQGVIDPTERGDLAERVMLARAELRQRLAEPEFEGLVEPFDVDTYNTNMTVAENLLFGTPKDASFNLDRIAENAYLRKVLHETGLMHDFVAMGRQLAELMVDLFADVAPESELFEQFSFISADDLPVFRGVLSRTSGEALESVGPEDRNMLLSLPFKLVPARHRLGLVDDAMRARLLHARRVFARGFGEGAPPVEVFDAERYNTLGSIQDNILFGRLAYGRARSASLARTLIRETVEKQGLLADVMAVGFDFQVGIGGTRLSGAQRQKLAIARTVLKRPDVLIVDDATAALDAGSQDRIMRGLLDLSAQRSLIWVVPHAKVAASFDTILVLDGGRVVEQGSYEELDVPGSAFHSMLAHE